MLWNPPFCSSYPKSQQTTPSTSTGYIPTSSCSIDPIFAIWICLDLLFQSPSLFALFQRSTRQILQFFNRFTCPALFSPSPVSPECLPRAKEIYKPAQNTKITRALSQPCWHLYKYQGVQAMSKKNQMALRASTT